MEFTLGSLTRLSSSGVTGASRLYALWRGILASNILTDTEMSQKPQIAQDSSVLDSNPLKRPVGRPKARIQLSDAERKAAYRLRLKQEALEDAALESEPAVSVLDAYAPIVKNRGGKTAGVSPNLLVKKIVEQGERCIYCDRLFGSAVFIDGRVKVLKAQVEHFQPRADRQNNNPSNILAACQICNHRIKGSRKFDSVEQAREIIQSVWKERGWTDAPDPISCPTCGHLDYARPAVSV